MCALQVPPTELEALLLSHPDVVDAAVVGVPDVEAGELPAAYIVRRADSSVTENQLQTYVAGKRRIFLPRNVAQRFIKPTSSIYTDG